MDALVRGLARLHDEEDGATAVIFAVMLVVLLGLGAFFIDAGALYSERRSLQGAADAGALAGVQELPTNPASATGAADAIANTNVTSLGVAGATVTSVVTGNDTVVCTVRDPNRQLMFAPFLNTESARVGASATAKVQSPAGYGSSVMPFGIMSAEPSGTAPFGYVFGEYVRLKQAPQNANQSPGNFQLLSLTDPPLEHDGAGEIYESLRNGGTDNAVYLNTDYFTRPGINGAQIASNLNAWIGGDTHAYTDVAQLQPNGYVDLLDPGCHRLIVCPIIVDPGPPVRYNWIDLNGSTRVRVIGFAYFFIEAIGKTGNDCWIDGRFIKPIDPDDPVIIWGPVDPYGAITYRLTN